MSKQSINIFIINLKTSKERRSEMEKQMNSHGLKYEFFDAVDGKKLDAEILKEIRDQPYSFKKAFGREMTLGEIGCAMSHLNLYRRMVDEQIRFAMILEDDIDFDNRLQRLISNDRTIEALNKLELVLLGYSSDGINYKKAAEISFFKRHKICDDILFCIPTVWNWSTIGYLISNSGAKKLLTQGTLPRMPADFLTANSPKYNVRLGIANAPLICPGKLDRFSHIGGGRGHLNELENISTMIENDDEKKILLAKRVYRNTRIRYRKIKAMIFNQWLKVNPKQYLYVSEKF